jgi:hypothetical protein
MNAPTQPRSQHEHPTEPEAIPLCDRAVLWMFVVVFILFAAILMGDLFLGFVR